MKRLFCIVISLFLLQNFSFAQRNDSLHVKISLLTCAPGEELYATFGHTAIRVIDSATHSDVVFNYGTFNFDEPNFYMKFVRGKLNFSLSEESLNDFMQEYVDEQRSVTEQDLNLTNEEKKFVLQFLFNNYLPQNRNYKYDFLYDNCATRIRDILFTKISGVSLTTSIVQPNTTFRGLIYFYLDRSGQPWSKLGIDILLGSPVDKKMDNNTAMFLPDFLSKAVSTATIHSKPYVTAERKILVANSTQQPQGKYVPLIVFIIVCALYLLLYFLFRKSVFASHLLDSILLYVTGLLGFLLLFMWFCTDHQTCLYNYNLLWALPTNFFAAFFIWKRRTWLKKYFFIATAITAILLACWWLLPQHFNVALIPFCFLMLIVYGRMARK
ncbi:MAG TPA: DUF4105 domain-containing protein [Arachidicoccus sp.]